jgi:hypothetical protein
MSGPESSRVVRQLRHDVDDVYALLDEVRGVVAELDTKVEAGFAAVNEKIDTGFAEILRRLDGQ